MSFQLTLTQNPAPWHLRLIVAPGKIALVDSSPVFATGLGIKNKSLIYATCHTQTASGRIHISTNYSIFDDSPNIYFGNYFLFPLHRLASACFYH